MEPSALTVASFSRYDPQARKFAQDHLNVLRRIPLPLLSILLAQLIRYDKRFPAEQKALQRQFAQLDALDPGQFAALMAPFATLDLSSRPQDTDWINQPLRFNEQLSALLWSTHQMDDFREAAHLYEEQLAKALLGESPAVPRFVIVLIGKGADKVNRPLFQNLRPLGVMFTSVKPAEARETLFAFVSERAEKYPEPYAHWYVEGGKPAVDQIIDPGIRVVSYESLAPFAYKELHLIDQFAGAQHHAGAANAEEIQSFMATLGPKELGLTQQPSDPILQAFQASIFTDGAGTQIFSTTFVQWTAREILRRAEPLTMLARFAPRQKQASMSTMLHRNPLTQELDLQGSLIDGDMGAYYTWLNLNRLSGDNPRFLVWFEDREVALAVSPSLARGTTSNHPVTMQQIINWMA